MSKDDQSILNMVYIAVFALVTFVFWKLFEAIGVQTNWIERYDWFSQGIVGLAFVAAAVVLWFMRRNKDRNEYLLSAIGELRKVSWPSWDDTKRMTLVVVIVVGIFAAILAVFDLGWSWALKLIIA